MRVYLDQEIEYLPEYHLPEKPEYWITLCKHCHTELVVVDWKKKGDYIKDPNDKAKWSPLCKASECPVCHKKTAQVNWQFNNIFNGKKRGHSAEETIKQIEQSGVWDEYFESREFDHQDYREYIQKLGKPLYEYIDLETALSYLHYARRKEYETVALQKHQELIDQQNLRTYSANDINKRKEVSQSSEHLKEYIHQLFILESNIYSIGKRLITLYTEQLVVEGDIRGADAIATQEVYTQAEKTKRKYEDRIAELTALQNTAPQTICLPKPSEPQKPQEPELKTPGLFNKKKVTLQNEALMAAYKSEYHKYEIAMAEHSLLIARIQKEERALAKEESARHEQQLLKAASEEQKIRSKLKLLNQETEQQLIAISQLPSPEHLRNNLIEEEIGKLEDLFKRTSDCLNQLYAYDIVFAKYRNMVALASFYEYLVSGRCTTLEGPNGAYNIFEAECRANQIIGQLTKIIDSLEQIKNNQYLVYTQLQSINSGLTRLETAMKQMNSTLKSIDMNTTKHLEHISKNSDVIAYNTAATAYYSQLNASLTNSLGYLVALH